MENKNGFWNNFRILVKSAIIGALTLLLLIPTNLIRNLVSERQQRQLEAVSEVDSHWAGPQTVTGPVIGIQYFDSIADNGTKQTVKRWAYFLPDRLDIHTRLVGFALCLFYTLLLSLAEYLGFNLSYLIAALATIGLISWYVGSVLRSSKTSLFIALLLAVQYGFTFILIQSQDYSLLMGSIGLFIILAIVMYFSRKIQWEKIPTA